MVRTVSEMCNPADNPLCRLFRILHGKILPAVEFIGREIGNAFQQNERHLLFKDDLFQPGRTFQRGKLSARPLFPVSFDPPSALLVIHHHRRRIDLRAAAQALGDVFCHCGLSTSAPPCYCNEHARILSTASSNVLPSSFGRSTTTSTVPVFAAALALSSKPPALPDSFVISQDALT